jgi:hypothetical protein
MNIKVYYPHKRGLHWIEACDVDNCTEALYVVSQHLKDPENMVSDPSPLPGRPWLCVLDGGKA